MVFYGILLMSLFFIKFVMENTFTDFFVHVYEKRSHIHVVFYFEKNPVIIRRIKTIKTC